MRFSLQIILPALLGVGAAQAQTGLNPGTPPVAGNQAAAGNRFTWQPVDQAVGDIDGLAQGLRRVESGLRLDGQGTSLFILRPADQLGEFASSAPGVHPGDPPRYLRLEPGFRAMVDRMDYLVPGPQRQWFMNHTPRYDGKFFELIPPNTHFDLTPGSPGFMGHTRMADPHLQLTGPDQRMAGQIDGRIDGRVFSPGATAVPGEAGTADFPAGALPAGITLNQYVWWQQQLKAQAEQKQAHQTPAAKVGEGTAASTPAPEKHGEELPQLGTPEKSEKPGASPTRSATDPVRPER